MESLLATNPEVWGAGDILVGTSCVCKQQCALTLRKPQHSLLKAQCALMATYLSAACCDKHPPYLLSQVMTLGLLVQVQLNDEIGFLCDGKIQHVLSCAASQAFFPTVTSISSQVSACSYLQDVCASRHRWTLSASALHECPRSSSMLRLNSVRPAQPFEVACPACLAAMVI